MSRPAVLLELLRAAPVALTGADADHLVDAAARHGLSAVVRHALEQAPHAALPAAPGETLRRHALGIAASGMKTKKLLLRALDALATEGLTPVLLKGYGLAARLYPDPLQRPATDVDLWLPFAELARAEKALQPLGLRRATAAGAEHDEQHHHVELVGAGGMVELHFEVISSFGHRLDGDPFWRRRVPAALEGRAVAFLAPEDELVYLAIHATHHMLSRLSWLWDLRLLIERQPELAWGQVIASAQETRMPALVHVALSAAARSLGAAVPAHVLAALAPPRWQAELARRLFTDARLERATFAEHRAAWYLAKALISPDLRGAARLAWHRLRPRRAVAARG